MLMGGGNSPMIFFPGSSVWAGLQWTHKGGRDWNLGTRWLNDWGPVRDKWSAGSDPELSVNVCPISGV